MVDVLDLEVRVLLGDHLAEGEPVGVELDVGDPPEARLQGGQLVGGGTGTGVLLVVEQEVALGVEDGDEALVEAPLGDGRGRAGLRGLGQLVEGPAGDALERGDGVGGHALVGLGPQGPQVLVARVDEEAATLHLVGPVGGHELGATGDHAVLEAGHDRRGGQVDGGDPGAAVAVEGDAARVHVVAGVERGHAAEVTTLGADLAAGAPDDVVHVGGAQVVPLGQRPQDGGTDELGVLVGQGPLADLAEAPRRADGVDDPCFRHCGAPWLVRGPARSADGASDALVYPTDPVEGQPGPPSVPWPALI